MTPSIKITRYPYEEPYRLNLVMEASNGRLQGLLKFCINTDELIKLADELEVFPHWSFCQNMIRRSNQVIKEGAVEY